MNQNTLYKTVALIIIFVALNAFPAANAHGQHSMHSQIVHNVNGDTECANCEAVNPCCEQTIVVSASDKNQNSKKKSRNLRIYRHNHTCTAGYKIYHTKTSQYPPNINRLKLLSSICLRF